VLGDAAEGVLQPAYFLGAGGLGAALYLIHMYVDPIKKAMQAMWAVGFAGSVGIALTTGKWNTGLLSLSSHRGPTVLFLKLAVEPQPASP
jgi:uncharacterized integral membrane protein